MTHSCVLFRCKYDDSSIYLENNSKIYLPKVIDLAIKNQIILEHVVKRIIVNIPLRQIHDFTFSGAYIIRLPINEKRHILYIGTSYDIGNRMYGHKTWIPDNCMIDVVESFSGELLEKILINKLINKHVYGNVSINELIKKKINNNSQIINDKIKEIE